MAETRSPKLPRPLGLIRFAPPPDYARKTKGEMFKKLCEDEGWMYPSIIAAIIAKTGNEKFSEDTLKAWPKSGVPSSGENREAFLELVETHCAPDVDPNEWIRALVQSRNSQQTHKLICESVLKSTRLTKLPALFESNQALPLATTYVDLRLAHSPPISTNCSLLEPNLTLAQRLNKRLEARYAVRRSPKDLLDTDKQNTLILGPPGAGKSSMLRRIAMDISKGKWDSVQAPLFVEARNYWASRKFDANVDMLTFAIRDTLPVWQSVTETRDSLLMQQASTKGKRFILLVDGLDEIAADEEAVNVIYSELQQYTNSFSWIVTVRPAGLMSSLGETHRCEMVELDDEAIETLIDNWCTSIGDDSEKSDANNLKAEIFGSPGTREMAGNPFLLTALCFLKSTTPGTNLPSARVDVYESLLDRIALQAQKRHNNHKILSPAAIDALQAFSFDLYDRKAGPIQIFSRNDWWEFSKKQREGVRIDFNRNILPARILTTLGENDPHFHFLHLTLQEHLVARAMLDFPVKEMLERRFSPTWRAVFRFYGALLWQRGRKDEFQELTCILYKEQDINGLYLLALAEIFSYAGIRDTHEWIGVDLREWLYHGAISGFEAGPEAMIDALVTLDPDWLVSVISQELDEHFHDIESLSNTSDEKYAGQNSITFGRCLDSPYEKLARTKTGKAKKIITDAFWGENQNHALMSAYAFAMIATPSDRGKIVHTAGDVVMFDEMATRIFAISLASLRPEYVPFLERVVESFSETVDGPFDEALMLVADIGGDEAASILERQLDREVARLSEDINAFEISLRAVVRMGGERAIRILENLSVLPETTIWRDTIKSLRFEADISDEAAVLEALSDKSLCDGTISAISGAAIYGRLPCKRIIHALRVHIDVDSDNYIYELASIEGARLDAGESPLLCDLLLKTAKRLYGRIRNSMDEKDLNYLIVHLRLIFDTLGRAPWKPTGDFIQSILIEKELPADLLSATIDLVGRVFANTSDSAILTRLKEVLFQLNSDHRHAAALAIGRIDLEELFRLQSAETATDAMEQIATDSNILIFDQFWTDPFGRCRTWINPPKKIFYAYDDETPEIPQIFTHELSRYGFCSNSETPDECVAYLIFTPLEDYAKDLAKQAKRLNEKSGNNNPLFNIPMEITEDKARPMAKTIGRRLKAQIGLRPLSQ